MVNVGTRNLFSSRHLRPFWLLLPALVLALWLGPIAQTDARPAPDSFADLVENLTPAVVNIATATRRIESSGESPFEELPPGTPYEDFFDFFNRRSPGGGAFPPDTSLGSGFIISPDGLVVTNNHVIQDAKQITVVLHDGQRLGATVIGRDPKTDLALLKVDTKRPLPFVEFGSSDGARVGDWVIAIGNPFGLGNTVTAGILSARGRDINAGPYDDFLQTDAPINRGNSGGPMFNMEGDVIGVNTLIYSPSGGSVGIGFATPSAIVQPVIAQLKEYGRTRRGWLGVRIQTVSPEIASKLGLATPSGALVAAVIEDGPAEEADIRKGDIILRFDDRIVTNRRALPRIVADASIGAKVPVIVWRDGEQMVVEVEVGRLEDYELAAVDRRVEVTPREMPERAFTSLGVTLATVTPELRDRFDLDTVNEGVVVTAIADGLPSDVDLRPGDVIVELAHSAIANVGQFERQLDSLRASDAKLVVVLRVREGEREFIAVEIRG